MFFNRLPLWLFAFASLFILTPNASATNPIFSSVTASSDNAIVSTIARVGDTITFTLTLAAAEESNGGIITFNIGSTTGLTTTIPSAGSATTHFATYTVLDGQNGSLNVTDIAFENTALEAITNLPTFPVNVVVSADTIAPVFNYIDDVEVGPVSSDDVVLTLVEARLFSGSNLYGFSDDAICDATDTLDKLFLGTPITINTEAHNNQYFCITALDIAGHETFAISANPFNIDVTPPRIESVIQSTSNINDRWATAGETVTYDITFSEAVTVSVNTASSASNISILTQEVDAVNATTDQLIFTAVTGDNGEVLSNVDFNITDEAGNTTTITNLAPISGASGNNVVATDTIIPTLPMVSITSDNTNSANWATDGDTITININASESLLFSGLDIDIDGENTTQSDLGSNNYQGTLTLSGDETEGVATFTINFQDQARNNGTQVITVTDTSQVTIDRTAPTIPNVSIASNNALDSSLARTNDTVSVTFTVADNLASNASIAGSPTILSQAANSAVTSVAAGQTISRFTDGTEPSETVVPFSFNIQDEAGNVSSTVTATTDGSTVRFDRTDPLVSNVQISATSVDSSAFLGDVPTYYAKQGDTLDFSFEVCDYVDSQNNPPTGDLFSQIGLTMTDGGLTTNPCTTPGGNTVNTRQWSAQLLNIDGTEGIVTFDIDVFDNAGNGLVNVVGTTDGSQVIFDKTNPNLPTDVMDLEGLQTTNFKHNSQADYTWSNDEDPLGVAPVSDIQNYDIRFNNPNTGINEMVTINAPVQAFTPTQTIPDLNDPYTVNMNIRDKAGNESGEQVVYTQRYGTLIMGTITDTSGDPLQNINVQVVSRFGETCNVPNQVCTTTTDINGQYSIVTEPSQSYTINYWDSQHYLEKTQVDVSLVDVTLDVQLAPIATPKAVQSGNQVLTIGTDQTFQLAPNESFQNTFIYAASLGGEISVTVQDNNNLLISSLSTIVSVRSNNPNITISRNANNTYTVIRPGNITLQSGANTNPGFASVGSGSINQSFSSGESRLGVQSSTGNGDGSSRFAGMARGDFVGHGKFWTPEESMEYARLANEGNRYKVNTYVNRNGYQIFAGYQSGKLPLKAFKKRFQNQVAYRGSKVRTTADNRRRVSIVKEEGSLAAKTEAMKLRFQNQEEIVVREEKPKAGYARSKVQDTIRSVMTKRHYQTHQQHKFARTRYHNNKASRISHKDLSTMRISHRGKSVTLSAMYTQQKTR